MVFSWQIIALLVLLPALCISVIYNIRFARTLLVFQEGIEDSLDILDSRYNNVTQILEKPVFFDSVEIRQVISEISKSRDAILRVANILGTVENSYDNNSMNNLEDV